MLDSELTDENKRMIVRNITDFKNSLGGQFFLERLQQEFDESLQFTIDQRINDQFTPFTREGLIGETRQLKAIILSFDGIVQQFVEDLKTSNNIEL